MLLLAWLDTHQDRISAVNGPRSLNFIPFYESYQVETLGKVTWFYRFNNVYILKSTLETHKIVK